MRIPFLTGRSSGPDPERRKLFVAEGRVPRPFPGPWTLRAVVRGDEAAPAAPTVEDAADNTPDHARPGSGQPASDDA